MAKHDIDSWILDETELAEHYKDIGKPEGYDSKMELVGLLKQLKEYQHLEEQGRLIKLPVKDGATAHRECVHIKSTCYHGNYKCSECPLTELFCDEFYKAIDRCYEEAYASGCLAGMDLAKSETDKISTSPYYDVYSKALDDLLNSLPDCDYVGIERLVCLVEQLKRGRENGR